MQHKFSHRSDFRPRNLSDIRLSKGRPMGLKALLGLSCAALIAFLSNGCNKNDAAGMSGGMPPPMVTVTAATTQDVPIYLDEIGKASASEFVTIIPQVSGKVIAKHFVDGADVHKGDLLFEIDPRPYQAALDQAKAMVGQERANLQMANDNYTRVDKLQGTNAVSEQTYDEMKNAVAVGDARVQAGIAAVETAKLNLEYCKIFSPIDGRTGERLVDPGNIVNGGMQGTGSSMLVIQRLDPIYADFTITESELASVRKYQSEADLQVQVKLPQDTIATATTQPIEMATTKPGEATTQASTQPAGQLYQHVGQLTFVDNAVQDGSGTVKLRATLPNKDYHFWPGQFVNVRLILMVQKDAVLVPNQAIQISQTGPFVYVLKADSTVDQRPISLGQKQGDLVVVDTGLTMGEKVIVTGQQLLMPGGKVTVAPPAPGAVGMTDAPKSDAGV